MKRKPGSIRGKFSSMIGIVGLLMSVHPALLAQSPPRCSGYGALESFSLTDWESGLGDWTPGTHDVANPDTFDTPDWAAVSNLPDQRAGQAAFIANLNIGNCDDDFQAGALNLDSPPIVIPGDVLVPRISVDHWFSTEYGWDGGNLKLKVNDGPFEQVPAWAIEIRPYTALLNAAEDNNSNPLEMEAAFTGPENDPGSWGLSHIKLLDLAAAGDTVQLRFDFGIDACDGAVGWYVDEVEFYGCAAELLPSDCGNSVIDAGEACDDGNNFIGDGCSNICEIESGWNCTDPLPPADIGDPGFEGGPQNPDWDETSSTMNQLICDLENCGNGFGSGPSEGDYWVWLGGTTEPDESSVSQTVTIPSTSPNLVFDFEAPLCGNPTDVFEVLIDGNPTFSVFGTDMRCEVRGYSTESVDISAYADDAAHLISFHSEVSGANGLISSFFVDDVRIPGTPSICTVISDLIHEDGFESP